MITTEATGFQQAIRDLAKADTNLGTHMRRALHRIGALIHKTAVLYAPISPTTSMLRRFARQLKRGGEFARKMYVPGRKGKEGTVVTLTDWYAFRLNALLRDKTRVMPGGLERSILFSSDWEKAEIFVPSNSPAGKYAAKINNERFSTWRELGPGSQAKGPQAREHFIERAVADNNENMVAILRDETTKAIRI